MEPSHSSEEVITEHHVIKRTLWQRWMAWNGSFLIISVLLHILLIGGATFVAVQVVQNRKEKLKFTAPPPSPNAGAEHKVKPSKKTAAAAPAIAKRITSTAINASVALPAMDLNSTGPDVMASVMSGLGSSGLGAGGAGGAGMASMPLAGMTAFGFRGMNAEAGLSGHLYDLKQDKDRNPTDIKDDGTFVINYVAEAKKRGVEPTEIWTGIMADKSPLGKRVDLVTKSVQNQGKVISEFLNGNWDESILKRYYTSQDKMTAYQIFIPSATPQDALKAYGVEKEIKPTHFVIYYKGYVKAPRDGQFRFRVVTGTSQCNLFIRFDGDNVYGQAGNPFYDMSKFDFRKTPGYYEGDGGLKGKWFSVQAGKKVPVEVLLENGPGGLTAIVLIEEKHPEQPYPITFVSQVYPQFGIGHAYPVFALRKGLPLPPPTTKEEIAAQKPTGDPKWRPRVPVLDYLPPLIFQGCK